MGNAMPRDKNNGFYFVTRPTCCTFNPFYGVNLDLGSENFK